MFQNKNYSLCTGLYFTSFISNIIVDQDASSNSDNVHTTGHQYLPLDNNSNPNSNPKTPGPRNAISTIPDASTPGDSAPKSAKFQVNADVDFTTQSNIKTQPTIANSIGNYSLGGEGLIHATLYACNSNPKNRVPDFCVLTIPDALRQCNSDPNCGGYDVTTNINWHNTYDVNGQTVVQLFAAGAATSTNTEWSFYDKPRSTSNNLLGNYSFCGKGIIHVASYNCNSNPKNVVSGYCVLTIPDALTQCNSDPNCGGIEVTTNVGWHNAYDVNGQTVVQLFAVGSATNPNAEWNCFNKPEQTVPNSIGNYAIGGQGYNRVSVYDCNSNPNNRVSGFCILTIPDALTQCNSDPHCGGIEVTTDVNWHNAYDVNGQTVVQLFAVGTAKKRNAEWSFYDKPQPTAVNSSSNYSFGSDGVIHAALYNCNSNPKNRVPGFCVLTIPDALRQCNSDPNCGGYDVTTNINWHNTYDVNGQTVVQLFAAGAATSTNTEWSFYDKPRSTSNNLIGNYSFCGKGIIHVASYNCNSNPKNVVSGYCVLTIPDALTQCNSDPNCGGIEVTTNVGWHNAYDVNGQTVVQLFAVGSATNPNAEWTCFNKPEPTVPNSIGNYAIGGQGYNRVSVYDCNSNPNNRVSGFCILTIPDALTQCNSDPHCGGIQVTTNINWHNAYDVNGQTVVQLFAVGTATKPNAEWSFYDKPQPTVVNSSSNYSFGSGGVIHVALYNCNSNPKNRAPGFCVLTIPDALTQCNADPNCGGYDVTTDVGWHLLFDVNGQKVVQLFAVGAATLPNAAWSFYKKPATKGL
ncbi:unnamed protein product [Rotaria socialis]